MRRRLVRAVLLYVVVPYVAVCLIFAVFQRRLLYQPTVADNLAAADHVPSQVEASDVGLDVADGVRVRGWHLRAARDGEPIRLVLYFPGNSLNRAERVRDLTELVDAGFDVLIADYRGFGDSEGRPSEANLTADAKRLWSMATGELGYAPAEIVVFGESLGGAVAVALCSHNDVQPAGVVLSSTFTSVPDAVADLYRAFPFWMFVLDRWDSIGRIGAINCPIVVFHGERDEMVPVEHGRRLARAANGTFHEVKNGSHNELPGRLLIDACRTLGGLMPLRTNYPD